MCSVTRVKPYGPGLEADAVGRARKLALEERVGRLQLLVGDHDLADQAGEADAALVEGKAEPLVVSRVAFDRVRDDERPVRAERLHQETQCLEVALYLDQGIDVEAGDHLGDAAEVLQVALRVVARPGKPALGDPSELAQVPGADQEVLALALGRDLLVERRAQPGDGVGRGARRGVEAGAVGKQVHPRSPSLSSSARTERDRRRGVVGAGTGLPLGP